MSNKKLTSEVIHEIKSLKLDNLVKALDTLRHMSNELKTRKKPIYLMEQIGICGHIGIQVVQLLAPFWTGYSGKRRFPVKHKDYADPELAYDYTPYKWKGDYGRSRIRLLRFIIKCLTQIVEEMQNEITVPK